MNKNGFTLIELLAVIIIIAVIASITVVSVNKTLKNSKNSLSDVQIDNIIKASKSYYLEEGMDRNVSCINVSDLIENNYIESKTVIDPRTKKPMEGSVSISSNGGRFLYSYSEDKCVYIQTATADNKTIAGKIPQGNYEPGDEYIVNVDGEHEYHFYVLSTEGDKVNLIMSRNICSDGTLATVENRCTVAWLDEYESLDSNKKGPISAMNHLHEATKNWSNIENIQMNYTDEGNTGEYGYGSILTEQNITKITTKDGIETSSYENLKVRLPKRSEIEDIGCTENSGSCPAWIINGLEATDLYPGGIKEDIVTSGYWCLPSYNWDGMQITYRGKIYHDGINLADYYGVRPVIEVSKMLLNK